MSAAVTIVRSTFTDSDTLAAAAFNAVAIASASVPDVNPGVAAGVMPSTTSAAGLAITNAANAAAQRTLLGLGTADTPTFAGLALSGAISISAPAAFAALTSTTGINQVYNQFVNDGGTYYMGVDNAAGSALGFGAHNMGAVVPAGRLFRVLVTGTGVVGTFSSSGLIINGQITQYSATFAKTGTSLTNAAEAQVATLTNAPVGRSGNPTKWVPIDDNGVTRYMPAW